jgi:hypothetical protein
MNKKRVIIWSVITLLTIMAVLEIFDLHPNIIVGHHKIVWSGFRNMIPSGSGAIDGHQFRIFQMGPVAVVTYL